MAYCKWCEPYRYRPREGLYRSHSILLCTEHLILLRLLRSGLTSISPCLSMYIGLLSPPLNGALEVCFHFALHFLPPLLVHFDCLSVVCSLCPPSWSTRDGATRVCRCGSTCVRLLLPSQFARCSMACQLSLSRVLSVPLPRSDSCALFSSSVRHTIPRNSSAFKHCDFFILILDCSNTTIFSVCFLFA